MSRRTCDGNGRFPCDARAVFRLSRAMDDKGVVLTCGLHTVVNIQRVGKCELASCHITHKVSVVPA